MRYRNLSEHERTDEVEFKLVNHVSYYYHLYWRFKPQKIKKKFLFWEYEAETNEQWLPVMEYKCPDVSLEYSIDNPYNDYNWNVFTLKLSDEKERKKYEEIKRTVKTYEQFNTRFRREEFIDRHEADKKKYNELVRKANEQIERLENL